MNEINEAFFQLWRNGNSIFKAAGDPKLGALIDQIGRIERAVDPDLFSAVVHIAGQRDFHQGPADDLEANAGGVKRVSAETFWPPERAPCRSWA